MTISYNWLNDYLPRRIEPGKLSEILTSIGLEVESLEVFESIKGSLKGLIVGEVITCKQHPNADKLKLTEVNINTDKPLQIVCGAPNVAAGQKVIVAPVGTTIHPYNNAPVTMKVAKIRGVESFGMICAEDEIGVSSNHEGIFILPGSAVPGSDAADYFNVYHDHIFEIGLTPNRTDAMSHTGVAKDVCAWLSHHETESKPVLPSTENITINGTNEFEVIIENTNNCRRYSGLHITNIKIEQSPAWLSNYLLAIGQRTINNIVDITNFVLHETGQPLHAFDADALSSHKIKIKNAAEGTTFTTLDHVERKLSSKDLVICNNDEPVCLAGVFGGAGSGVTAETKNIFLESAWFSPATIRQTSLRYGLRTDAAVRFEKGVDISGTLYALQRAAQLIKEIAGGTVNGGLIDVFPEPVEKKNITLNYAYLQKLTGKQYDNSSVKNILIHLDFEVLDETQDAVTVAVPLSKNDVLLPADVVEEIVRIDGLNNIETSKYATIFPAAQHNLLQEQLREKLSNLLVGLGFNEIVVNSITNSKNFAEETLASSVRLLNNLSADLDIMRPTMLETGLEILSFNINRKNNNLCFFEFGKKYRKFNSGYVEEEFFCLWISVKNQPEHWKKNISKPDFFTAKGILRSALENVNIAGTEFCRTPDIDFSSQKVMFKKTELGKIVQVDDALLARFEIKQPVIFIELNYRALLSASESDIIYKQVPQYPAVERDLAIVVDKSIKYGEVKTSIEQLKIPFLQQFSLFDIFESEKIGNQKKSFAINFTFINTEKTLTDPEVDEMMKKIIIKTQTDFNAEIRN